MNEKEFNLAILAELKRIANEVFAKVTVSKEGTYTAAELWNEKDAFGESIVIDYKGTESEIYTAEIGTFKMQITPQKLWYVLWKFERLCNVKQADKMRFTYGKQEGETISEKAIYLDKSGKEVTRKKSLVKLSERVAIEADKKTKSYNMYYLASGVWFLLCQRYDESQYKAIKERIEKDENYLFSLLQRWDFNTENRLNHIYKALFEDLKSERINNTPEQRKSENEPENTVICEVAKVNTSAKEFNKHEALKDTEKRMREYHPNYIALIRYNGMYYSYGESAKNVRLSDGVRNYITDPGDYICFPESLLDAILPKLIKAGRGVLTCDIIEDVPEDYPPEPYNESDTGGMECPYDEPSCKEIENERPICDYAGKSANSWGNCCLVLPGYLRQKVFPTELFYARRKIRRFKPRYFVGYTNYHLWKESVVKRKRNGNTSVYRTLIRGETGISRRIIVFNSE